MTRPASRPGAVTNCWTRTASIFRRRGGRYGPPVLGVQRHALPGGGQLARLSALPARTTPPGGPAQLTERVVAEVQDIVDQFVAATLKRV